MKHRSCSKRPASLRSARSGLSLLLCAAISVGTGISSHAQSMVAKWSTSTFASGSNRGLTYNPATGHLLLVTAGTTFGNIKIIDAATGDAASPANMPWPTSAMGLGTGIPGGTHYVAGIAVGSDGAIYGCNYTASGTQYILRWADEASDPTVLYTGTLPAGTTGSIGANMAMYGGDTNAVFVLSSTATTASTPVVSVLVHYDGTSQTWVAKTFTVPTAALVAGLTFMDKDVAGPGVYRMYAKCGNASGNRFAFNPTTNATAITPVATTLSGTFGAFSSNGPHGAAFDPRTGLIAWITRVSTSGFFGTNGLSNTGLKIGSGTITAPAELGRVNFTGTSGDGGSAGGVTWGKGAFFTSAANTGNSLQAYDVTAFLVSAPPDVAGTLGGSATFSGVFGGSSLVYQWKRNGNNLTDDGKYAGTTTEALTINDLQFSDAGSYTVTVNGVNSSTATSSGNLVVNVGPAGPKTWNGGGADDNWGTVANWDTGLNAAGDTAFFDGSVRLTPVMDTSYSLNGLTFNSGAGAFVITSPTGTLTMAGGITNNSANLETVNLPIALAATRSVEAASGNVELDGVISGVGGITKSGAQNLYLRGASANTFSGALTVNGGGLVLGKTGGNVAVPGNITVTSGSLTLETSNQIGDAATVDLQTSDKTMTLAAGISDVIGRVSIGSLTASTTAGTIALGANSQLTMKAASTFTGASSGSAVKITGTTGSKFALTSAELRWTPQAMVNTFEKLVIATNGVLRLGHGGNAWNGQDTMLGAVPVSFMQDQICITNAQLGFNGGVLANKIVVSANRGMTIGGLATNETLVSTIFPGKITGSGMLVHNGGVDLELRGLNDFSGGLRLLAGSVTAFDSRSVGTGTITFSNATAVLAASGPAVNITNKVELSVATNSFGNTTNFTVSGPIDVGSAGSSPKVNITNASTVVTFSGALTNTLGLEKIGLGTLVLSGSSSYGGATLISEGTLKVNNTVGSGTSSGALTVALGATLGGTGTVAGTVAVNGTVSPGSSVGRLTTGSQAWNSGGHYTWEINNATGVAGTGWDLITINGGLTINANSGSQFTIDVASLAGAVAGNAANFNNGTSQSWTLVTTTTGITGFSAAAFNIVTNGFSNSMGSGTFAVAQSGNNLVLTFTIPGPEIHGFVSTTAGAGTFVGKPNTGYYVQYTDNLTTPLVWQTLTTVGNNGVVTTDGSGNGSFVDPSPKQGKRFYHVAAQ